MPGNYAHYRFGQAILPTLPQEIRRTVGRFRQLFDMGLHGPDILFYHDLLLKSTVSRQGHKLHNQTGKSFFERACRAVRMNPTEAARAYLYGLLAHYALDSLCHPYIKRAVEAGSGSHREIETEFDRYLLELDGKSPAHRYDQSVHMQLTPGECETAALFFPNVSAGAIRRSVKNMAACTRILALPRGSRREMMTKALGLVRPGSAQLVIPVRPDPHLLGADQDLLMLFDSAKEQYVSLLDQIRTHLRKKTPLGPDFSLIFG